MPIYKIYPAHEVVINPIYAHIRIQKKIILRIGSDLTLILSRFLKNYFTLLLINQHFHLMIGKIMLTSKVIIMLRRLKKVIRSSQQFYKSKDNHTSHYILSTFQKKGNVLPWELTYNLRVNHTYVATLSSSSHCIYMKFCVITSMPRKPKVYVNISTNC